MSRRKLWDGFGNETPLDKGFKSGFATAVFVMVALIVSLPAIIRQVLKHRKSLTAKVVSRFKSFAVLAKKPRQRKR